MKYLFALLSFLGFLMPLSAETLLRDGDTIEMKVAGAPLEFTQEFFFRYTVDDGAINVPMIGRVKAINLSPTQLAAVVEKKLIDDKIFTRPSVIINVESGQRLITVGGAVRNPGRQLWNVGMTLSQAIMAAGGPSEWAKDSVKVVRAGKAEQFSRKAINKDPSKDPAIKPGDFVELAGAQQRGYQARRFVHLLFQLQRVLRAAS